MTIVSRIANCPSQTEWSANAMRKCLQRKMSSTSAFWRSTVSTQLKWLRQPRLTTRSQCFHLRLVRKRSQKHRYLTCLWMPSIPIMKRGLANWRYKNHSTSRHQRDFAWSRMTKICSSAIVQSQQVPTSPSVLRSSVTSGYAHQTKSAHLATMVDLESWRGPSLPTCTLKSAKRCAEIASSQSLRPMKTSQASRHAHSIKLCSRDSLACLLPRSELRLILLNSSSLPPMPSSAQRRYVSIRKSLIRWRRPSSRHAPLTRASSPAESPGQRARMNKSRSSEGLSRSHSTSRLRPVDASATQMSRLQLCRNRQLSRPNLCPTIGSLRSQRLRKKPLSSQISIFKPRNAPNLKPSEGAKLSLSRKSKRRTSMYSKLPKCLISVTHIMELSRNRPKNWPHFRVLACPLPTVGRKSRASFKRKSRLSSKN